MKHLYFILCCLCLYRVVFAQDQVSAEDANNPPSERGTDQGGQGAGVGRSGDPYVEPGATGHEAERPQPPQEEKCPVTLPNPHPSGDICVNLHCPKRKMSCLDAEGTGDYEIMVMYDGTEVLCDMKKAGGGWTVIQRRQYGNEYFYRDWKHYKNGFGKFDGDFYLGNQKIYEMTYKRCHKLRIDMKFNNATYWAEYSHFRLWGEAENYELEVEGYSGDAGDSLRMHNHMPFSTKDKDNDLSASNCAQRYEGAWWFRSCFTSHLNGKWETSGYARGVVWGLLSTYYNTLDYAEMKIRPCY